MENLISLKVKYLGPTDTRGSRVKMTLPRFECSKTIPYLDELRDSDEIVLAWLKEHGIIPKAQTSGRVEGTTFLISFYDCEALLTAFGQKFH